MLDWFSSFGGAIGGLALFLAMIVASIYAGAFAARRAGPNWAGWVVGMAVFFLLYLVFERSIYALRSVECRGTSDYQWCMEG